MERDTSDLAVDPAYGNLLSGDIGARIREARTARGMTLAALGGEELSRSFLSLVERGKSRISLRALGIVAQRLELPVGYFLESARATPAERATLVLGRAEVRLVQRDPEGCLRELETLPRHTRTGLRATWLRSRALADLGSVPEAIPLLEEVIEHAEEQGDDHLAVQARYVLGSALYTAGSFDESLVHARAALVHATQTLDDPQLRGKITVLIGHILVIQGAVDDALEQYDRARALVGATRDLRTMGSLYSALSMAYDRKCRPDEALRYAHMSLGIYEREHNEWEVARETNNIAVRYRSLGRLDDAAEAAQAAVSRAQGVQAFDLEAFARATLAAVYLRQGQDEAARAEAEVAERLVGGSGSRARVDAWLVLAELSERAGDQSRADEDYQRSIEALRLMGQTERLAETLLAYSAVLRSRGNLEAALDAAFEVARLKATRATHRQ